MRLRRVVRDLNASSMAVVVEGEDGNLREISLNWLDNLGEKSSVPPAWYETLKAEYQEALRKEGPLLDLYDIG